METVAKIKQKDVAKHFGVSTSFLSEVINKKRRPSWDMAKLFAAKTGCSPLVWMEGTTEDMKNLLIAVFGDQ